MKKIVSLFICWSILLVLSGISSAAEKIFYYHTDQAGTPLAMTDESGTVVWKADYKPFGEEQSINPAAVENNEKFIGKEKDKETGLYYFGARYMQDKIGRFTSPDPVGAIDQMAGKINQKIVMNPQRLNPYAYSINNPYRYVDPNGEELIPIWLPGLGNTFLDDQFAPSISSFIISTKENGVELYFTSAYRRPEQQAALKKNPKAITPADNSLHSAGFAVDVNFSSLGDIPGGLTGDKQRSVIKDAASQSGLDWGGNFRKPDPPHFYHDPGGDRTTLIDNATTDYNRLKDE